MAANNNEGFEVYRSSIKEGRDVSRQVMYGVHNLVTSKMGTDFAALSAEDHARIAGEIYDEGAKVFLSEVIGVDGDLAEQSLTYQGAFSQLVQAFFQKTKEEFVREFEAKARAGTVNPLDYAVVTQGALQRSKGIHDNLVTSAMRQRLTQADVGPFKQYLASVAEEELGYKLTTDMVVDVDGAARLFGEVIQDLERETQRKEQRRVADLENRLKYGNIAPANNDDLEERLVA